MLSKIWRRSLALLFYPELRQIEAAAHRGWYLETCIVRECHSWLGEWPIVAEVVNWQLLSLYDHQRTLGMRAANAHGTIDTFREHLRRTYHDNRREVANP